MSNFTTNTYTMKREILNFSNKLSKDLTRPKKKFVADMTYGMLASKGRFATWMMPANPTMIEAGVAYGIEYAEGNVEKNDYDAMMDIFKGIAKEKGVEANFSVLEGTDNFLLFTIGSQIF